MANIKIIIQDKDGDVFSQVIAESYELGQELTTLNEIEGVIEQLKNTL